MASISRIWIFFLHLVSTTSTCSYCLHLLIKLPTTICLLCSMIRNTRLVFSHNELSKLTMMNHQMDYRTLRRAIFTKNLYNFSAFTTYLQDSARKISNVLYFFYSKMIMLIVVVFLFSRKFILKLLTRSLLFIVLYYVHTYYIAGTLWARTPWLLRTCKQKWPDLDSYRLVKSWASYASSLADRLTATPTMLLSEQRRRVRWSFGISQWDKNKC